jgi:hypothetical protein
MFQPAPDVREEFQTATVLPVLLGSTRPRTRGRFETHTSGLEEALVAADGWARE